MGVSTRPEEIGMQRGRILEYMPSTMLRQYLPSTAAGMMNQLDERESERELETKERERESSSDLGVC